MTRRRILEAVGTTATFVAIQTLPPLVVELMGHALIGVGRGLIASGKAVERAGDRTLQRAYDLESRQSSESLPDFLHESPKSIRVGGVRYLRQGE